MAPALELRDPRETGRELRSTSLVPRVVQRRLGVASGKDSRWGKGCLSRNVKRQPGQVRGKRKAGRQTALNKKVMEAILRSLGTGVWSAAAVAGEAAGKVGRAGGDLATPPQTPATVSSTHITAG